MIVASDSLPAMVTARRLAMSALLGGVLLAAVVVAWPSVARSSAASSACGFHPVLFHRISDRTNITCVQAKRVLLTLRGRRGTIPMICGRPRIIGGWHVENVERHWAAVINRYSRGDSSFVYLREQHARRTYCPPKR